jgi:protein TIF31
MDDTQVLLLVRLSFLLLYICFKKKAEFGQLHQVNFGGWEQHERSTYNILVKQLGEEDSRTRESANWIKTFQIRENQVSTQLCEVLLEFYSCMRSVCL